MPGLEMELPNGYQSLIKHEIEDGYQSDNHLDDDFLIKAEAHEDDGVYRPRPQLGEPFVGMRPLSYLMSSLEDGTIDVNPEYQREVVWTGDRMTGLINSLMENYYIPPIILNKKILTNDDGTPRTVLVCVDGKQRLSSVRAFVQGLVHCNDHRGEKWWFKIDPGSTRTNSRRVLPEATKAAFLAKEFITSEFSDLSQEQEEDLFARVQMGVQLSAAEKMRAQTGPWQELARLYVEHFPSVFALLKNVTRAKDFQMALSCFSQILEVQHPSNPDGIPILRTNFIALPKLLLNTRALDDDLKSHYRSVFATFAELIESGPEVFTNTDRKLKGVQTFAPVELVAVSVLISMYSDTRNNKLLLGDVRAMRNHIRDHYNDIRMNAPMWSFLWEWIDNLENYRGSVPGTVIDRRPRPSARALATPKPARIASPAKSASKKRGRPSGSTKYPTVPVRTYDEWNALEETRSSAQTASETPTPTTKRPKLDQTSTPVSIRGAQRTSVASTGTPAMLGDELPMHTRSGMGSQPGRIPVQPPKMDSQNLVVASAIQSDSRAEEPIEKQNNQHFAGPPGGTAPTAPEARASRISELHSFRAPVATPVLTAPMAPSQTAQARKSSQRGTKSPSIAQPPPVPVSTHSPMTARRTPVFVPQPKSIQKPAVDDSSAVQIADQLQAALKSDGTSLPREAPLNSTRPKTGRKTTAVPISRPEDLIDLTSDTEQERQDLLSSFHSRSTNTKVQPELERQKLISTFKTNRSERAQERARHGIYVPGSTRNNSVMIDDSKEFPINQKTVRKGPRPTRGGFSG